MYWYKSDIRQMWDHAGNKTVTTLEGLSDRIGVDLFSLKEKYAEIYQSVMIGRLIVA